MPGTAVSGVLVDGVRVDELLEHATAALHVLARDQNNRACIRQLSAIPLVVKVPHGHTTAFSFFILHLLVAPTPRPTG